ncbi:MAG: enoyl-CoA hydratase/isomerase family protein [Phycisphaerales bacterium]|jgi:cyclohexa-1,5-dienecarbonyl-CoA hydratase|nr:enoyl-CoA hydratase/isomerase family protein [Phycisphaerales bacterium]
MSDYQYFNLDITGGVATVTMNLPPLNVMDNPMMSEFNTLLDTLVADNTLSAIVIAAEGKAFSAGVDVADHTAEKVRDMIERFHGIFRRLASTDAITIAAVQGAALGGGCELACFCDIVLASERAKFGQPEVHVGVFPPVAAAVLPSRIGLGKAIELVALGGTIAATEAHRIGLINQVYAADEFADQVAAYVDGIRGLSRPVVRMAKRATMVGQKADILNRLDEAEKIYLDELMQLHDAHEGIAAFMEKRTPEWSHA